jgi:DNA-binding NarL/FixJ family response regulator
LTLAKFVLSPEVKDQLETACHIRLDYVDNVRELFNYITNSSRQIHTIIIGSWPEVFTEAKLSIIEVINAVRTLIHCSGQDIKLAVGINSDVDPKTIQEIRRMPIDYIWPGGTEFAVDIKIETMEAMLAGESFTHPKLDALLKPRRIKSKPDKVELTPRQHQIMEIVSQRGANNKTIARMLNITESTVKLHMSGILKKYGVRNRTQLALFARDKAEA